MIREIIPARHLECDFSLRMFRLAIVMASIRGADGLAASRCFWNGVAPMVNGGDALGRPRSPAYDCAVAARDPGDRERREWQEEFEAAARRPLRTRLRYAFIRTYKPVLDDAPYRSFDSMAEYRAWCAAELPSWLGYGPEV